MVDKAQRSRGLYTPELEHDACGIGFVAHLKNRKSHQVVTGFGHARTHGTPWRSGL